MDDTKPEASELSSSPNTPLYVAVSHALIRRIKSGKLQIGIVSECERDLAQNLESARTARLALKELENSICHRQGRAEPYP